MTTFKKKDLNELIGGDMNSGGGDRNVSNDSEIETGPVQKPYDDSSDYEKGQTPTMDKITNRYRQDIPWFAVYSYGTSRLGTSINNENTTTNTILKKKNVEEKIEDLVKKSKDSDVTEKNYNPKISKIIDTINDIDLTDKQLEDLSNAILNKKNNTEKTKKL